MEGSVYVKAHREWDERYADLVLGKRNWQIAATGLSRFRFRPGPAEDA
jgi:type IV secretory pathway TrbF-like protein